MVEIKTEIKTNRVEAYNCKINFTAKATQSSSVSKSTKSAVIFPVLASISGRGQNRN